MAIGAFFLVWAVLRDGGDESPFTPAGLAAASVIALAVVLREVVLRSARDRFLASQRLLDRNLRHLPARAVGTNGSGKLTLEKNAAVLQEISRKSEAAKVLGHLAVSHKEVVDLCAEYLAATARELPTVGVGSPRLAALRRGSEIASICHRYHLLQWAGIQSRTLTHEAQKHVKLNDKLGFARQALGVIEFGLKNYPNDPDLLASETVLNQLIASMQASSFIEKAERAKFKGNNKRAISLYKDALFHLARGEVEITGTGFEKIAEEIEKLRGLPEES